MALATYRVKDGGKPRNVTEAEWRSRVECAAGYRLLDLLGLTDLIEGVVGVRVADEPDAFLLQPYGMFFDEVRASDLVKVRFDEEPDAGRGRLLNYASCKQVKYVLRARPDVNCVLHAHTKGSAVVATLEGGLLPVAQHHFIVANEIAYADFEADVGEECIRKDLLTLGEKKILLIRNHGMLIVARSVAEAIFLARTLEVACQWQLEAMQTGAEMLLPDAETVAKLTLEYKTNPGIVEFDGTREWPGFLRRLDRENPGYDT
jgi:ribulose-5-phosphate 4-epimerase/fuculose-1-phosphate aldolase